MDSAYAKNQRGTDSSAKNSTKEGNKNSSLNAKKGYDSRTVRTTLERIELSLRIFERRQP